MHSVDLLEEALQVAQDSGFEVRQEWLDEKGGGACRVGEKRLLYVDLSLAAHEQLEQVVAALRKCDHLRLAPNHSKALIRLVNPEPR